MSAPDTNIERQHDKHKVSLFGIKGALAFGVLMLVLMIGFTASRGLSPSESTLIGTDETRDDKARNGVAGVTIDPYAPGTNQSN